MKNFLTRLFLFFIIFCCCILSCISSLFAYLFVAQLNKKLYIKGISIGTLADFVSVKLKWILCNVHFVFGCYMFLRLSINRIKAWIMLWRYNCCCCCWWWSWWRYLLVMYLILVIWWIIVRSKNWILRLLLRDHCKSKENVIR